MTTHFLHPTLFTVFGLMVKIATQAPAHSRAPPQSDFGINGCTPRTCQKAYGCLGQRPPSAAIVCNCTCQWPSSFVPGSPNCTKDKAK